MSEIIGCWLNAGLMALMVHQQQYTYIHISKINLWEETTSAEDKREKDFQWDKESNTFIQNYKQAFIVFPRKLIAFKNYLNTN